MSTKKRGKSSSRQSNGLGVEPFSDDDDFDSSPLKRDKEMLSNALRRRSTRSASTWSSRSSSIAPNTRFLEALQYTVPASGGQAVSYHETDEGGDDDDFTTDSEDDGADSAGSDAESNKKADADADADDRSASSNQAVRGGGDADADADDRGGSPSPEPPSALKSPRLRSPLRSPSASVASSAAAPSPATPREATAPTPDPSRSPSRAPPVLPPTPSSGASFLSPPSSSAGGGRHPPSSSHLTPPSPFERNGMHNPIEDTTLSSSSSSQPSPPHAGGGDHLAAAAASSASSSSSSSSSSRLAPALPSVSPGMIRTGKNRIQPWRPKARPIEPGLSSSSESKQAADPPAPSASASAASHNSLNPESEHVDQLDSVAEDGGALSDSPLSQSQDSEPSRSPAPEQRELRTPSREPSQRKSAARDSPERRGTPRSHSRERSESNHHRDVMQNPSGAEGIPPPGGSSSSSSSSSSKSAAARSGRRHSLPRGGAEQAPPEIRRSPRRPGRPLPSRSSSPYVEPMSLAQRIRSKSRGVTPAPVPAPVPEAAASRMPPVPPSAARKQRTVGRKGSGRHSAHDTSPSARGASQDADGGDADADSHVSVGPPPVPTPVAASAKKRKRRTAAPPPPAADDTGRRRSPRFVGRRRRRGRGDEDDEDADSDDDDDDDYDEHKHDHAPGEEPSDYSDPSDDYSDASDDEQISRKPRRKKSKASTGNASKVPPVAARTRGPHTRSRSRDATQQDEGHRPVTRSASRSGALASSSTKGTGRSKGTGTGAAFRPPRSTVDKRPPQAEKISRKQSEQRKGTAKSRAAATAAAAPVRVVSLSLSPAPTEVGRNSAARSRTRGGAAADGGRGGGGAAGRALSEVPTPTKARRPPQPAVAPSTPSDAARRRPKRPSELPSGTLAGSVPPLPRHRSRVLVPQGRAPHREMTFYQGGRRNARKNAPPPRSNSPSEVAVDAGAVPATPLVVPRAARSPAKTSRAAEQEQPSSPAPAPPPGTPSAFERPPEPLADSDGHHSPARVSDSMPPATPSRSRSRSLSPETPTPRVDYNQNKNKRRKVSTRSASKQAADERAPPSPSAFPFKAGSSGKPKPPAKRGRGRPRKSSTKKRPAASSPGRGKSPATPPAPATPSPVREARSRGAASRKRPASRSPSRSCSPAAADAAAPELLEESVDVGGGAPLPADHPADLSDDAEFREEEEQEGEEEEGERRSAEGRDSLEIVGFDDAVHELRDSVAPPVRLRSPAKGKRRGGLTRNGYEIDLTQQSSFFKRRYPKRNRMKPGKYWMHDITRYAYDPEYGFCVAIDKIHFDEPDTVVGEVAETEDQVEAQENARRLFSRGSLIGDLSVAKSKRRVRPGKAAKPKPKSKAKPGGGKKRRRGAGRPSKQERSETDENKHDADAGDLPADGDDDDAGGGNESDRRSSKRQKTAHGRSSGKGGGRGRGKKAVGGNDKEKKTKKDGKRGVKRKKGKADAKLSRDDARSDHSDNGDEDVGGVGNSWGDEDVDVLEEPLLPSSPGSDQAVLLPPAASGRGHGGRKSAKSGPKHSSTRRAGDKQQQQQNQRQNAASASSSSGAASAAAAASESAWGAPPAGPLANDVLTADEYRSSCGPAYTVKETGLVINDDKVEEHQLMAKTRCMVTVTTIPHTDQAELPPTMLPRAGKSLEGADYACGYLELPPGVKKCAECPTNREVFYVIRCDYKKLRVRIHNTYFYLSAGAFFSVPPENVYTVENLSHAHSARLTFMISRPDPGRVLLAAEEDDDDMESLLSEREELREGGDFAEDDAQTPSKSQDDARTSPGSTDKDGSAA